MSRKALRLHLTGRVQGVGFRAWARDEARARGLAGWVRNEPDGSVSALLAGPADAVDAMVGALREGPSWAEVDDIRAEPADADDAPDPFEVRR